MDTIMKRTIVFILIQTLTSVIYWSSVLLLRTVNTFLYSFIDTYIILIYFILVIGFVVYYVVRIFPHVHRIIGLLTLVFLGMVTILCGQLVFYRKIFNEFEIMSRCDNEILYSQYKGVFNGGRSIYTKSEGKISSDITESDSSIQIYDTSFSGEYIKCLAQEGYRVEVLDLSI